MAESLRLLAAALLALTACRAPETLEARRVRALASTPVPAAAPVPPAPVRALPRPSAPPSLAAATPPGIVEVRYRVDVRATGAEGFAAFLAETMSDPAGWSRAGFRVVEDGSAAFTVVVAEGAEVDALCLPYDTGGRFSCQNGPVVAINAQRWREGVPHWTGDLASYRRMLLNHEMGHLLGQHHRPCSPGRPAPVMYQQSGSLKGCLANDRPLDEEIARAARHDLKLAPAYGE